MTFILRLIAGAAFGLSAGVATAVAQPAGPTLLGTFDQWEAYKTDDTTNKRGAVCYAVTQPQTKEPAAAKRDPIYFLITTWPKAKIANEPSVVIGYQFKPGQEATAQVGSDKFAFFTKADGAWMQSNAEETRLITSMRGSSEMTVKGMSARGTLTTDTYSLKGISAALDKVNEGCK